MKLDVSRWSGPQRRAILSGGHNVLVSAGAGSGKTSVLVERVARCVLEGVDIDGLLVVTFTEAAAAEMRQRIVERLNALAESSDDPQSTLRLKQQRDRADQAQISTLHSFCMAVVRRNFLALGIEPTFRLVDEDEWKPAARRLFGELVDGRLSGSDREAFRTMLRTFGAEDPTDLQALVRRMNEFSRSQPDPFAWLERVDTLYQQAAEAKFVDLPWTPPFFEWVRRELASARLRLVEAATAASRFEELDGYARDLEELREGLEAVIQAYQNPSEMDAATTSLAALLARKAPRAPANPLYKPVKELRSRTLSRLRDEVLAVVSRGMDGLRADILDMAPAVSTLVKFIQDYQVSCQSYKQRHGLLDFSDLEHLALRALRDSATGEARRMQAQYSEIFVDEYQDTSPIQDAIVSAVARQEGNVFVVGDVKQSIYRFRMAEPNLFLNLYAALGNPDGNGASIDLTDNYRSRAGVVHAVNFLFSQLFSTALGGIEYDERARMKAGAAYPHTEGHSLEGPVEVHWIELDPTDARDGDRDRDEDEANREDAVEADGKAEWEDELQELLRMEQEALVIATRIQELMAGNEAGEPTLVYDRQERRYRPISFRDIVVLMRSVRSKMPPVLDVFRRVGIPAYGATSTGFFGALETRWLLSMLSALDNPLRDLDFVTLLRSPLGGFTDEELAQIRLAQQNAPFYEAFRRLGSVRPPQVDWSAQGIAESTIRHVVQYAEQFSAWRDIARRASVEETLHRVLTDTSFLHYVCAMEGGDIRRANVALLLDRARAFDRQSHDGVYGFVSAINDALEEDVDSGEARTLAESEDVVRVMTIHQSKGLEFPVVFVADLGKAFYRDPQETRFPVDGVLGFGPPRIQSDTDQMWSTLPSVAMNELELSRFRAEEARILYVALTRARERLILVGSIRQLAKQIARSVHAAFLPEISFPPEVLLGASGFHGWLLPALLRHRNGHLLLDYAADMGLDVPTSIPGVWADSPASLAIVLWKTPGGRELPPLRRENLPSPPARITGEVLSSWLHDAPKTAQSPLIIRESSTGASPPAKISATDLRRLWTAKMGLQQRRSGSAFHNPAAAEHLLEEPRFVRASNLSGRESGTAFHRVMQWLPFTTVPSRQVLFDWLREAVADGRLTETEAQAVNVEHVVQFLSSSIGQRLANASQVLREQPFFRRLDGFNGEDFVIVQGVIDCLARDDAGWLLVDYKTDRMTERDIPEKCSEYAAQVATYRDVVAAVAPDTRIDAYLYFVNIGAAVPMQGVDVRSLFR